MNNKHKHLNLLFIMTICISSALVLVTGYKFYIEPALNFTTKSLYNKYNDAIINISNDNSKSIDSFVTYLETLDRRVKIYISISDLNNNNIYHSTNKEIPKTMFYSSIIEIDNNNYNVTLSTVNDLPITNIIMAFIFTEFILFIVIIIFLYLFNNKKNMTPLEQTINDISNYKFGIKPKRINGAGRVAYIQNEFVNLVDELDLHKEKQNQMVASISHDLKTPLTSILGYTELLKEEETDESKLKYLDKIHNKSLNMKDILNDFDEYLSDKKSPSLVLKQVNINELVNQLNYSYKDDLKANDIKFIIKNKCQNTYINIDISRIKRVFSNLISNSIRYFKNDNKEIVVNITEDNSYVIFRFSDNGIGVDYNYINRIFDPLFTTDKSRKISGLGLYICKDIIDSHQGTIKAYNNKKGGLTIEFTIKK